MVVAAIVEPDRIDALRGDAIASLAYVANWHFIFGHQSYFEQFQRPSLFRHLWSLAVEEQFYLFWPLVFAAGMKLVRPPPAAASACSPGRSPRSPWPGSSSTPARRLARLLRHRHPRGRAAGRRRPGPRLEPDATCARRRPGRWSGRSSTRSASLALGYVVLSFVHVHDYDLALYHGGYLWLALFTALLIAVLAHPAARLGGLLGAAADGLARPAQLQLLPLALAGAGADPAGDRRLDAARDPDPAAAARGPRPRRALLPLRRAALPRQAKPPALADGLAALRAPGAAGRRCSRSSSWSAGAASSSSGERDLAASAAASTAEFAKVEVEPRRGGRHGSRRRSLGSEPAAADRRLRRLGDDRRQGTARGPARAGLLDERQGRPPGGRIRRARSSG